MAMALGGLNTLPQGKRYALSGGFGAFDGHTGVGFGGVAELYQSAAYSVYASGGLAVGTDTGEVGGRGSLSIAW